MNKRMNEWGFRPLLCTLYTGSNGPREPPEDGELNPMTLPY